MRHLLTVLNVLLGVTLILWPVLAMSTLFMFDAPGSESNRITIALAIAVLSYPLPVIAGNIGFWISLRRERMTRAVWFTLLGFTGWIAILLLILALSVVCDGQFACP